jgi:hypothetical protein
LTNVAFTINILVMASVAIEWLNRRVPMRISAFNRTEAARCKITYFKNSRLGADLSLTKPIGPVGHLQYWGCS